MRKLFHHQSRGQHVFDAGFTNTVIDQFVRKRIVQVNRNAFVDREREVGDRSADGGRDQYANVFFIFSKSELSQQPTQDQRAR